MVLWLELHCSLFLDFVALEIVRMTPIRVQVEIESPSTSNVEEVHRTKVNKKETGRVQERRVQERGSSEGQLVFLISWLVEKALHHQVSSFAITTTSTDALMRLQADRVIKGNMYAANVNHQTTRSRHAPTRPSDRPR